MKSAIINHQLREEPDTSAMARVRVEATPGRVQEVDVPQILTERHCLARLAPVPGKPGFFRAAIRSVSPLVPVTDDLGERMGWGLERRQILALGIAGLIDAFRATTGQTLVDPASVWEHIYNTRLSEAAEFWTAERVQRYKDAQEFVRATGIVDAQRRREAAAVPHMEFDFGEEAAGE